jgi:hypothetical protein
MPITTLPNPPTRQDPTNFAERADTFLAALPTFATEANQLATEVNGNANTASVAATNAQAAATAATASAGVTLWNASTTYTVGQTVYSPSTFFTYRRKVAGQTATDPASDTTNWTQVTGTGNVNTASTSVTMTGSTFTIGGSLGVGTVAPQIKTHVVSGTADVMRLESTTPTSVLSFRTSTTGVNPYIYGTGDALGVVTNGFERVRFEANGNLVVKGFGTGGLGTGSSFYAESSSSRRPVLSWYYDVSKNSDVTQVGSPASSVSGVGSDIRFFTGVYSEHAERMCIDTNGNVLINSAPATLGTGYTNLHTRGSTGAIVEISNATHSVGMDMNSSGGRVGSRTDIPFSLICNNIPRLTVLSDGNIGIGTVSPTTALDVKGSGVTVQSSDGLNISRLTPTGSGSFSDTNYSILTNNIARVTVTNGGSVGVGTESPTAVLDINSTTMRLRSKRTISTATSTGNQGDWCYDDNFFYVCIATNTWKRMALSTW